MGHVFFEAESVPYIVRDTELIHLKALSFSVLEHRIVLQNAFSLTPQNTGGFCMSLLVVLKTENTVGEGNGTQAMIQNQPKSGVINKNNLALIQSTTTILETQNQQQQTT